MVHILNLVIDEWKWKLLYVTTNIGKNCTVLNEGVRGKKL